MNTNPVQKILTTLVVVVFFVVVSHLLSGSTGGTQHQSGTIERDSPTPTTASSSHALPPPATAPTTHSLEDTAAYIHIHHALPDYYLTKSRAAAQGWLPSKGNLCDIAPDTEIGGDVFTNSEHILPSAAGRTWYEADFDYTCGHRNSKRILYSSDGLVYTTTDHYRTVTLIP